MNKAYTYSLKVYFSDGFEWDLTILAKSANDALSFVNRDNENSELKIIRASLVLMPLDSVEVKESFCAKILEQGV